MACDLAPALRIPPAPVVLQEGGSSSSRGRPGLLDWSWSSLTGAGLLIWCRPSLTCRGARGERAFRGSKGRFRKRRAPSHPKEQERQRESVIVPEGWGLRAEGLKKPWTAPWYKKRLARGEIPLQGFEKELQSLDRAPVRDFAEMLEQGRLDQGKFEVMEQSNISAARSRFQVSHPSELAKKLRELRRETPDEEKPMLFPHFRKAFDWDARESLEAGRKAPEHFFSQKRWEEVDSITAETTSLVKGMQLPKPSRIQFLSFPDIIKGRHSVIADQSGSGKTLAYLLPLLQRYVLSADPEDHRLKLIVIAPTSDLVHQIADVARVASAHGRAFRVTTIVGGGGYNARHQRRRIQEGCELIVATPGRLKFFMEEDYVLDKEIWNSCQAVVVDEVDALVGEEGNLNVPQLKIQLAPGVQWVFVTATVSEAAKTEIQSLEAQLGIEASDKGKESVKVAWTKGPGLHRVPLNCNHVLIDCTPMDFYNEVVLMDWPRDATEYIRRVARACNWKSAFLPGWAAHRVPAELADFETSGEEDLEPRRMEAGFQGANGFFIDFVSRKTKSRHPLLVMLLGDARSRQRMARRASQSEAGIKMLQSYKDAKALINFERLEWNLLNLLTNFWKKLQHPSWATPPDVLQQIVRRIHMQHQMESCVQAELEEHILELHKAKSDALRQAMAAKREDDDSDESVRRQGFWHTFHRGTRKGEPRPVTPAKTELYLPALNGAGWVQPRSRGNSSIEEVEIHRQDGGKNATLSGKARNRLEVSKLPQRGAGISKSAPDLKRAHKFGAANHASGLLPSIGPRLQKAAAADQDRCRFTPPNSKRGDSKMWWFQSGLEEHRDYIQREEVASKRHSRRNLLGHVKEPPMPPTSFGSHCPIFHLGPCPIDSPGAEPRRSAALLPPIEVVVPVHEQLGRQEVAAASRQYIHACQREQVVPVPSTFVTGHSRKVDAAGKAVVDSDLLTLCAVGRLTEVEDVDLSGGKLLSDVAMGTFLQDVLLAPQNLGTLQRLSLSECVHAARQSQAALVRLLQEGGASRLHFLDLSGVSLAMRHLGPFCQAVEKHPALQTLRLCNAGLGGAMDVRNCLRRILSGRIQVLDFGWNCLLAEELKFLGELVSRNKNLRQLGLANCAASSQKNSSISPCVYFLEQLVHGVSLTNLDISMNRIDFRGALVIEDALERSRRLSTLNVSHNPLGVMGLRCLLRLLARQDSGLVAIDMENCFSGELRPSVEGIQVFTYTNPGGHYSLDLTRPYHRSLLRTLYKVGQHLKLNPVDTFHVISYDSGHFTLASQPDAGVWPVPSSGWDPTNRIS
ncbi:unnamed protein product [Effrenium voratum]|nr:unnamed protein product [Effrenium voratum]